MGIFVSSVRSLVIGFFGNRFFFFFLFFEEKRMECLCESERESGLLFLSRGEERWKMWGDSTIGNTGNWNARS